MIENEFVDTTPVPDQVCTFQRKDSWSRDNQKMTASLQSSFREATVESISDEALRQQIRERRRATHEGENISRALGRAQDPTFGRSRSEGSDSDGPCDGDDKSQDQDDDISATKNASVQEWMNVNFFQEVNYLV
mmetsp:Transcript_3137/g.3374  ORF Transcript_3137/g.3374 Transcript_3137/m.3374 type:complete len:134 (+) Transcript_3137:65-466(+)